LHIDLSGPLPLPMERKGYWLKIGDEFSGYSRDYFMAEKSSTTTIVGRQLAIVIRVKTIRCDNAKEQMEWPSEGHALGKWSFG
jgi:hypothetical protein